MSEFEIKSVSLTLSFDFQYGIEIKHKGPLWQSRADPILPLFASHNHTFRNVP